MYVVPYNQFLETDADDNRFYSLELVASWSYSVWPDGRHSVEKKKIMRNQFSQNGHRCLKDMKNSIVAFYSICTKLIDYSQITNYTEKSL